MAVLVCCFGGAEAFAVGAGVIEAADAFVAFGEHVEGVFDAGCAGFGLFGGFDPVDPVEACKGGGGGPGGQGFGGGLEGLVEVGGDLGFGFLLDGGNFECDCVAYLGAGGFAELFGDFEPVAELAVGFEGGLERVAVEGSVDGCAAASGEGVAGGFWED